MRFTFFYVLLIIGILLSQSATALTFTNRTDYKIKVDVWCVNWWFSHKFMVMPGEINRKIAEDWNLDEYVEVDITFQVSDTSGPVVAKDHWKVYWRSDSKFTAKVVDEQLRLYLGTLLLP